MVDFITRYCEARITQLKSASDEELQAEIDRPARGGFNPDFDFDKWCALIILHTRKICGLTREDRW